MTTFEAGSIRESVSSKMFVTQIASPSTATPDASSPVAIRATAIGRGTSERAARDRAGAQDERDLAAAGAPLAVPSRAPVRRAGPRTACSVASRAPDAADRIERSATTRVPPAPHVPRWIEIATGADRGSPVACTASIELPPENAENVALPPLKPALQRRSSVPVLLPRTS